MPRYRTIVVASAADFDALTRGADALGDERVILVAHEDTPRAASDEHYGTRTVVSMELDEVTTHAVSKEAHAIYERIRHCSGLPAGTGAEPVAMTPMNRLLMFDPKSSEFFRIAENLYDNGDYLYAVVAAQTAFELHMEGVFEYILHLRGTVQISAAVGDLIRSYNLDDPKVRKVWEAFTGHKLTEDAKTWTVYKAHLERRHGLVHRGERVSKEEATASLRAVNELATQISAVVLRLMPGAQPE